MRRIANPVYLGSIPRLASINLIGIDMFNLKKYWLLVNQIKSTRKMTLSMNLTGPELSSVTGLSKSLATSMLDSDESAVKLADILKPEHLVPLKKAYFRLRKEHDKRI